MSSRAISLRCPQCGGKATSENPSFPFCCKRCRLIDLGKWFSEEYAVPGQEIDRAAIPSEGEEGSTRDE